MSKPNLEAMLLYRSKHERIEITDMAALWSVVAQLPGKHDAAILPMLYDEDGERSAVTLLEAGKARGISGGRVRHIRERALSRLSHIGRVAQYGRKVEKRPPNG